MPMDDPEFEKGGKDRGNLHNIGMANREVRIKLDIYLVKWNKSNLIIIAQYKFMLFFIYQ